MSDVRIGKRLLARSILGVAAAFALGISCISPAEAGWKPEYGKNPPEVSEWFRKAATINPEAFERISAEIRYARMFETPFRPLTEEDKAWMRDAMTTPEARARLRIYSCCDHGDRVKTKFRVDASTGEDRWQYLDPATQKWNNIPKDIVHHGNDNPNVPPMPEALKREGVLFMWHGKEVCFWPPEPGD